MKVEALDFRLKWEPALLLRFCGRKVRLAEGDVPGELGFGPRRIGHIRVGFRGLRKGCGGGGLVRGEKEVERRLGGKLLEAGSRERREV